MVFIDDAYTLSNVRTSFTEYVMTSTCTFDTVSHNVGSSCDVNISGCVPVFGHGHYTGHLYVPCSVH